MAQTLTVNTARSAAARPIPILPLRALTAGTAPLVERSAAWPVLAELFASVAVREPAFGDATRWHVHAIGGAARRFGRPLTFTPYASAEPCSARCRFCSETLRADAGRTGPMAAALRPGPRYFEHLRQVLAALDGVPLAYSLSGLEATDDTAWFLRLVETLRAARNRGPAVDGAVLYTNGHGFVDEGPALVAALQRLPLSWVEWSRHHDDAAANQRIMRFRPDVSVAAQDTFERALRETLAGLEVRLVCVVQQGGIESAADVRRYLGWARRLGVRHVIFRALSALPAAYQPNVTQRYIESHRVDIESLLLACAADPAFRAEHEPLSLTSGYYFWNARWCSAAGHEVVFEAADYGEMHKREGTELIYKLVFHANGNLCAGWQPEQHVLWRAPA